MKETHTHHIIPRSLGGTNDPENMVELLPKDHAIAHLVRYRMFGQWQDKLAYIGLSGQSNKYEIQQMKRRLANLGNKNGCGSTHTPEYKKRLSVMMTERRKENSQMGNYQPHTEETKAKISKSLEGNSNRLGKTGNKMSDESKAKMSERMKGDTNPVRRPEVREKLRQRALEREARKREARLR